MATRGLGVPSLSDEYGELQSLLVELELRRKRLNQELQDATSTIARAKLRMREIEDEAEGRVQQSLFEEEK